MQKRIIGTPQFTGEKLIIRVKINKIIVKIKVKLIIKRILKL